MALYYSCKQIRSCLRVEKNSTGTDMTAVNLTLCLSKIIGGVASHEILVTRYCVAMVRDLARV